MDFFRKLKFYIILLLAVFNFQDTICASNSSIRTIAEDVKTSFKITIKNSLGEPQKNVFLKILGRSEEYRPDSCGVISFEYDITGTYKRNANIYLNNEPKEPVKTFILDESNISATFKIDTREELLSFKQNNTTYPIEGIVTNESGEAIEGAIVTIQGTGRQAITDEIGLFKIDADFNHNIIIRADGMENMTMNISRFLVNPNEAFTVKMQPKNGNKIYSSVEKMPEFPGGMKNFKKYIDINLKYPEKALKEKIEGVVVMQFVVEKNGEITNTKIMRRLNPELDTIAYRLIEEMPRWTPASDFGIKVRCKYSVPIAFKIPVPKPVLPNKDSSRTKSDSIKLVNDSIVSDSLERNVSLPDSIVSDSISYGTRNDSILSDSLRNRILTSGIDSIGIKQNGQNDSIISRNDSIGTDSANIGTNTDINKVKAKKKNIFIRFFRWLFGIKDKDNTGMPDDENNVMEKKDTERNNANRNETEGNDTEGNDTEGNNTEGNDTDRNGKSNSDGDAGNTGNGK